MKKLLKDIKFSLYYVGKLAQISINRIFNRCIKRKGLTPKGEKLLAYFEKIVLENYHPVTYEDTLYEDFFKECASAANIDITNDETRQELAGILYLKLMEY
jgi:hypothetical protein